MEEGKEVGAMIDEKVLIERLEENIFVAELHGFGWDGQRVGNLLCLGDVKEIAEKLASEHNNGWIPCSERLPEISNSYLVTKMCENDGNPIYETAHEIFWTNDKKWDCERDEYCEWKVTAWQNKLSPYKKGE